MNSISRSSAKFLPLLAFVITLVGFMLFDPEPNWLLSLCSGINAGILIWAIYKLYKLDLLLSPLGAGILGVANIIYYSLGNLGARIEGSSRYLANPGALDYYPSIALLSMIGLLIFVFLSLTLYTRYPPKRLIHYQDFTWQPWQGLFVSLLAGLILIFIQIPTENIFAEISRMLTTAYRYVLILVIIINVSIVLKSKSKTGKATAIISAVIVALVFVIDRSRTNAFIMAQLAVLCWISIKPKQVKYALFAYALVFALLFSLGTYLKFQQARLGPQYLLSNLEKISNINISSYSIANQESFILDAGYRMAGFELPATILLNYDRGIPPINGGAFGGALLQGLPRYIRPEGDFSDRRSIFDHFGYRGYLVDDEIMGIPLASGLADFGIFGGIAIYIVMAFVYWIMWLIVQRSPRLYISFLMISTVIFTIDLFWVSIMVSIRSIIFCWLILLLFDRLLMPKDINKSKNVNDVHSHNSPKAIIRKFLEY